MAGRPPLVTAGDPGGTAGVVARVRASSREGWPPPGTGSAWAAGFRRCGKPAGMRVPPGSAGGGSWAGTAGTSGWVRASAGVGRWRPQPSGRRPSARAGPPTSLFGCAAAGRRAGAAASSGMRSAAAAARTTSESAAAGAHAADRGTLLGRLAAAAGVAAVAAAEPARAPGFAACAGARGSECWDFAA